MYDKNSLKNWLNSSYLTRNNQSYIDKIYKEFIKNPQSVENSWISLFQKLYTKTDTQDPSYIHKKLHCFSVKNNTNLDMSTITKISKLITAFRTYGNQYAVLDPLGLHTNKSKNSLLELEYYNFSKKDLQQIVDTKYFDIPKGFTTLQNIYNFLKETYCGSIGIEYTHIADIPKVMWIQEYFESKKINLNINNTERKQFLTEIIQAEGLEHYLGVKFPGSKRFSLEGGDVLIPMLKEVIRYSSLHYDTKEVFFGMAHRGRLNVLINILGKNPQDLFNEFSNKYKNIIGSGDVKYHQGLYSNITINGRTMYLSLLPNPSHLEIVTPIVLGSARSKMDHIYNYLNNPNQNFKKMIFPILPIIIHGDAAVSAQGVVQESFNMSNTHAYSVNGSIHIIINNQIGFTTSNIYEMRSTLHCTDIGKMIQIPIIHVNADDVEAVIFVIRFALNFRNKFKNDVIIDLVSYRRHGHNEADEPSVTQPLMYQKIRNHPTVKNIYADFLNKIGIINDDVENITKMYRLQLEKASCLIKEWHPIHVHSAYKNLNHIYINKNNNSYKIIDSQYLKNLAYCVNSIPDNIIVHDRIKKIYCERIEMSMGNRLFDWGGAETLAYATILDQGTSIRLSGEDVARGTFFHRNVVIHDQVTGIRYIPLMNIRKNQGSFFIWNSVLSEESTLAFEYGYANISSNMLVIWEAQFGDFSNGAQVVIDQFISSGEQKWNQSNNLVMMLPHGYEGQGPEHSSCRIERYLQLCAEYNMKICVPSTPSQIYHILRAQANNTVRKPLIIVSPKSLLRNPMATSSLEELSNESFKTVINENDTTNVIISKVNRVIICTGKIYYDLLNKRHQKQQHNVAIIRIEQLYPFPYDTLQSILQLYINVKDFIWCQEEPKNQGAWYYIQRCFIDKIPNIILNYVGRISSAAPAVGYFSVHQQQQKTIVDDALNLN